MNKVLITGATGFIGRQCLPLLLARADEVHGVTSRADHEESPDATWHTVNLMDTDATSRLVARVKPTHLLHLAWITTPGEYWTSKENARWAAASLFLVREFARHGGERIVIAGSCTEYDWSEGWCQEATTRLAPATPYGKSKHKLHLDVEALAQETGLSAAWGRIFFAYGPHEKPVRFVPSLILPLLKQQPAYCRHGKYVRDYLHTIDIADALTALLESRLAGALNIASGHPVALRDIATKIAEDIGHPELLQCDAGPRESTGPALVGGSVERLAGELAWAPRYDLDRGLNDTIVWWRKHLAMTSPPNAEPRG
ncbi:MAG: NAD-dependent epimerase/dehydratase family protein [Acidobacteriota bacterium]